MNTSKDIVMYRYITTKCYMIIYGAALVDCETFTQASRHLDSSNSLM